MDGGWKKGCLAAPVERTVFLRVDDMEIYLLYDTLTHTLTQSLSRSALRASRTMIPEPKHCGCTRRRGWRKRRRRSRSRRRWKEEVKAGAREEQVEGGAGE